jgi:MarR family 2-MHQ and catechol resistance regulon transcriptional repressor
MKTDLGHELTAAVMATADVFLRESQRLFRPHGLTAAQYNVLNILAATPDGISQRELGDRLVVDRSNVTGLLDRLEKIGWVRRTDDPADRRVYRVVLTPAGRALWGKIAPLYREVVAQITHGLSAKRLQDGLDLLKTLEAGATTWKLPNL